MFVMELRQANPRRQGDIGEGLAAAWLLRAGFGVWLPFGHSPDTDLIAQREDRLFRIQVKTTTAWVKRRWVVSLCTRGGNQSWNKIVKHFSHERCDYLFVLTGDQRCWFIPAKAVEGKTAIVLAGPKYSEYEVTSSFPRLASTSL